jgi:hypothetical protein
MIGIDRRWSRLEKQFRAADGFGRLICWGLMTPRECLDALVVAGAAAAPEANASGRRAVLAWALRDAIAAWTLARQRARSRIARALDPLLTARRSSADLLAAAHEANADAGDPLTAEELREAVATAVGWHLRKAQREGATAA